MKIPRQNETRRKFDAASQRFRVRFGRWKCTICVYDTKKLQILREFIPYSNEYTNIYDKDARKSLIGKEESTSHGWYCEFSKFDIRLQRFSNPFRFQPFPSVKFITNGQFMASIRHVDNRFFDLADPIYIYLYIIKYISRRVSKQVGRDKQSAK